LFYGDEEFFGRFRREKSFLGFSAQGMKFAIGNREFSKIPDGIFVPIDFTKQREMF
jgi:hypothetical protein